MIKPAILFCAAVLLSACGFHLRGALALPADIGPIRVTAGDPYSPLAQGLAQALGQRLLHAARDHVRRPPSGGQVALIAIKGASMGALLAMILVKFW